MEPGDEINIGSDNDVNDYYGEDANNPDCNYDSLIKEEDSMDSDSDSPVAKKRPRLEGPPDRNYTVLKQSDIRERQENTIAEVATVLSVSKAVATVLLRHYNWSAGKVHEAWFSDEDRVRKNLGLLPIIEFPLDSTEIKCGICFDLFPTRDEIVSAACGHPYCVECFRGYIRTSINDGPGCLMLRCPDMSCSAVVDRDMVNSLVSEEEKQKYSTYLYRSYVEENKKIKWCPGPGCEHAIEFDDNQGWDVTCACDFSFCWNCVEDAHRPVDCETVANWMAKNDDESETKTWILAQTKPCPKCAKPIEKNEGCMHMTCHSPCRYQFCWICLGDWHNHINCNGYKEDKRKEVEEAKRHVQKYNHYYERWAAHNLSRLKAVSDLGRVQTEQIEQLSEIHGKTQIELGFIAEAWQQIVECRRVLKWTYAYGYYLPEAEDAKKQLFEFLQGEAEAGLERLHGYAEKEVRQFLNADERSVNFEGFELKLKSLTGVTKKYFEKLVRALENGLSEVQGAGKSDMEEDWYCDRCTFANSWENVTCQMCHMHQ
ncbi:probable E3 ubiquitin-protein ligase ARI8 [Quercus suber]|uniref:probable E3 ubiquitin-protein ligase ARI8 n=1 Tax=Quercus suber TaxID=58331 RepID=UPI000CE1D27B|nr:probable E3 ubiquitin-protein ligase ARI8 [Quercus suber]